MHNVLLCSNCYNYVTSNTKQIAGNIASHLSYLDQTGPQWHCTALCDSLSAESNFCDKANLYLDRD